MSIDTSPFCARIFHINGNLIVRPRSPHMERQGEQKFDDLLTGPSIYPCEYVSYVVKALLQLSKIPSI